ncbi:MAG: beta galactosidase jelly roll domain-containing protein, partial [Victivallales bacterium]|nr:beta galactosidase jelly roll domain-containing protein [Victivallales bacterium]
LSQNFGFIHYRKRLEGPLGKVGLRLFHVNDYAQVWLDGHYLGSRMRDDGQNPFPVEVQEEGAVLDILVENCGRINYGVYVGKDFKGITQAVAVEFQEQLDWEYYSLPLDSLDALKFAEFDNRPGQVRFHRGEFQLDATGDTFLRRPGTKGSVWINGFHLGRYWNIGPTETLYVPAPVLKRGVNEIIIMEQEALESDSVSFQATPDLGETE